MKQTNMWNISCIGAKVRQKVKLKDAYYIPRKKLFSVVFWTMFPHRDNTAALDVDCCDALRYPRIKTQRVDLPHKSSCSMRMQIILKIRCHLIFTGAAMRVRMPRSNETVDGTARVQGEQRRPWQQTPEHSDDGA